MLIFQIHLLFDEFAIFRLRPFSERFSSISLIIEFIQNISIVSYTKQINTINLWQRSKPSSDIPLNFNKLYFIHQ